MHKTFEIHLDKELTGRKCFYHLWSSDVFENTVKEGNLKTMLKIPREMFVSIYKSNVQ